MELAYSTIWNFLFYWIELALVYEIDNDFKLFALVRYYKWISIYQNTFGIHTIHSSK